MGYKLSTLEKGRLLQGGEIDKFLIVGIDPGNIVGIAALDLRGNLVSLTSRKFAKRANLIKYITELGLPLIIASDVNPMPKSVERIARGFGCKTFYPKVSLTNVEKLKLLQDLKREVKGYHQKDALAAALKAYRHFHPMLKKVEDELKASGMEALFDDVASLLLKEEVDNIKAAIARVLNEKRRT